MISLIWATDKNNLIGKDNKMPWKLPADLAYFKSKTIGRTVIMGRKTFESFKKPLSNRNNVIISRDEDYDAKDCTVVHSIEEALKLSNDDEVFIIGGEQIYSQFLPYADRLYITFIEDTFEGDTYFNDVDFDNWNLISKQKGNTDKKNPYEYYFTVYERKTYKGCKNFA